MRESRDSILNSDDEIGKASPDSGLRLQAKENRMLGARKTTMIYTRVLNWGPAGVRSPVDGLRERGSYADPHKTP